MYVYVCYRRTESTGSARFLIGHLSRDRVVNWPLGSLYTALEGAFGVGDNIYIYRIPWNNSRASINRLLEKPPLLKAIFSFLICDDPRSDAEDIDIEILSRSQIWNF